MTEVVMEIKILGISGSPVKKGNTEAFLEESLKEARAIAGVSAEMVSLAGRNIQDCVHCNWCLKGQQEGQFCRQKDDMSEIYPLILGADGLLLASPAYFGRLSGRIACFIDRLRVFSFGGYYRGHLKGKVGGAMAVGWFRYGGVETTLLSINAAFPALGMLTPYGEGAPYGAGSITSIEGTGKFTAEDKIHVLGDEYGLRSARTLAKRMVELIKTLKLGKEAG